MRASSSALVGRLIGDFGLVNVGERAGCRFHKAEALFTENPDFSEEGTSSFGGTTGFGRAISGRAGLTLAWTSDLAGGVGNGRDHLNPDFFDDGDTGLDGSATSGLVGFLSDTVKPGDAFLLILSDAGFLGSLGEGGVSSIRDKSGDLAGMAGLGEGGVSSLRDKSGDLAGMAGLGEGGVSSLRDKSGDFGGMVGLGEGGVSSLRDKSGDLAGMAGLGEGGVSSLRDKSGDLAGMAGLGEGGASSLRDKSGDLGGMAGLGEGGVSSLRDKSGDLAGMAGLGEGGVSSLRDKSGDLGGIAGLDVSDSRLGALAAGLALTDSRDNVCVIGDSSDRGGGAPS
jgi:hypothetical protein